MEPKYYTNHSGGAEGADMAWDKVGREFGVTNHIHWRTSHLRTMTRMDKLTMEKCVDDAAIVLGRPLEFKGKDLVRRNWFQAHHAEEIFAIGRIVPDKGVDFKGFVNTSGKEIVAGGTGWTVEMAIQMNKKVHIFDLEDNTWKTWDSEKNRFVIEDIPILTISFAGIGSRGITERGEQAIRDVYKRSITKT